MPIDILKSLKEKIKNFDYFELGNSWVLLYLFSFVSFPAAVYLYLIPVATIKYIVAYGLFILNWKIIIYLSLGLFGFIAGYHIVGSLWLDKLVSKIPNIFKKEIKSERVILAFWFSFLIGVGVKVLKIFKGVYFHLYQDQSFANWKFSGLVGYLDMFNLLAIGLAFCRYFQLLKQGDVRYKTWRLIAWGTLILDFGYNFFGARQFAVVSSIMIYLVAAHYFWKPSYKRAVMAAVLLFAVLMPLGVYYKQSLNEFLILKDWPIAEKMSRQELNSKVEILYHARPGLTAEDAKNFLSKELFSYSPSELGREENKFIGFTRWAVNSSIGRIGFSYEIVSAVIMKTQSFLHGENLKYFFINLGPPRFLWANKPVTSDVMNGNVFGRSYGVINKEDFQTTAAPTFVGDLYMNFGLAGIILGMFFFGVLFRFIFDYLIKYNGNLLAGVIIYSIIWLQFMKGFENWIAPVCAGIVKMFIMMVILYFLLVLDFNKINLYGKRN